MEQRGNDEPKDPHADQPLRRRGTGPQEPTQPQAWGQPIQPGYGPPPGYAAPPAAPRKNNNKLGLGCGGLVILLVGILIGVGIGKSDTTSGVTTTPAAGPPAGHSSGPAAPAGAAPGKATVGSTVNISGFHGETLGITLVQVVPGAKGADELSTPDAGKQFVAVQLRITDTSPSVTYSDSPDNCVVAKDASGQQYRPQFDTVTVGQNFDSVNIAPGDSVLGVEVFELPVGDSVTQVQYTIDSGMGSGTAQWSVG